MTTPDIPVVFVHGLWLHAESWAPWLARFAEAGYSPSAPGWPGEPATVADARSSPEHVAGHGINDVVDHYAEHIARLPAPPIVVGHSFGGLIAQRLLAQRLARAAVALDAAPIRGVILLPASALRVASIALRDPRNLRRAVSLTPKQFRYGFGNALSEQESQELYDKWSIPSPGKPLFEASAANIAPGSPAKIATDAPGRGPLLLIAGGRDHTVPASITRSTRKQYHSGVVDYHEFPDRGHSLGIDHGWGEVADAAVEWLGRQSL